MRDKIRPGGRIAIQGVAHQHGAVNGPGTSTPSSWRARGRFMRALRIGPPPPKSLAGRSHAPARPRSAQRGSRPRHDLEDAQRVITERGSKRPAGGFTEFRVAERQWGARVKLADDRCSPRGASRAEVGWCPRSRVVRGIGAAGARPEQARQVVGVSISAGNPGLIGAVAGHNTVEGLSWAHPFDLRQQREHTDRTDGRHRIDLEHARRQGPRCPCHRQGRGSDWTDRRPDRYQPPERHEGAGQCCSQGTIAVSSTAWARRTWFVVRLPEQAYATWPRVALQSFS